MEMNATTFIQRPVNDVYAYVMEVSNDVHWRSGVTEAGLRTEPPIGVGTIGFAKGGDQEGTYRITSLIEREHVDWELLTGPFQGYGGYRFESVQGGTRFTLAADLVPAGIYKLMGPVFGWFGRRGNQRDVEKLREILEGAA